MDKEKVPYSEFTETGIKLPTCVTTGDCLEVISNKGDNTDNNDNTSIKLQNDAWQNHTIKFNLNNGSNIARNSTHLHTLGDHYMNRNVVEEETHQCQWTECDSSSNLRNVSQENDEESYYISIFQHEHEEKEKQLINLQIEQLKDKIDQQKMLINLKNIKTELEKELFNKKNRKTKIQ